MSVHLSTSNAAPESGWRYRVVVAGPGLPVDRVVPDLGKTLEEDFDVVRDMWWELAKDMVKQPSALLSHTPACVSDASDFGLMMAWDRLVERWAAAEETILVLCDDPWMFRHFEQKAGVEKQSSAPPLQSRELKLKLRGFVARLMAVKRALFALVRLRTHKRKFQPGGRYLLVYGHPASSLKGGDAYFGDLLNQVEGLRRVFHVDCPAGRAQDLAGTQSVSLHAWGSFFGAFRLITAYWKPEISGPWHWLLRRAAHLEGATGTAPMIRWQQICQKGWLAAMRPKVVAWPWEHHAWERHFIPQARLHNVRTLGYQHATVSPREWNHSPNSDPLGTAGLPDLVVCNGSSGRAGLESLGVPGGRIVSGGALRPSVMSTLPHDPDGPVFVALPANTDIAEELLAAVRPLARKGRRFLIRLHPFAPIEVPETEDLLKTDRSLEQQDGVSAVLFAATTVGLEAMIGGLPTLRFLPTTKAGHDLPLGLSAYPQTVTAANLEAALDNPPGPFSIDAEKLFDKADFAIWRGWLNAREQVGGSYGDHQPSRLQTLIRKVERLITDPVLRRWMFERLRQRRVRNDRFEPGRPAYLANRLDLKTTIPAVTWPLLSPEPPSQPVILPLPGAPLMLTPNQADLAFDWANNDLERLAALHRFSWLPLIGNKADPAWVNALWQGWIKRYREPDGGWAWEAYTAAERAINLLTYGQSFGLPGGALTCLADHGPAIAGHLEYYGETGTSNHLANNGRGLYFIGVLLDIPAYAELGATILEEEAKRLFGPSGMLREGSSHYHLLVTHQYKTALDLAERQARPEQAFLRGVVDKALAAASLFDMPGGFPLIGDISPDMPPSRLAGLIGQGTPDLKALAKDGWHRLDHKGWSLLAYASPMGWPVTAGHAHQDFGSFELHYRGSRLILDTGRGGYGDTGDAALYTSAQVHNGLMVDGLNPYPENRPYYDDSFRRDVCGNRPSVSETTESLTLAHDGFRRLSGVETAMREITLQDGAVLIKDTVQGTGRHVITRRLHAPAGSGLNIEADGQREIRQVKSWSAYGENQPAEVTTITNEVQLPWCDTLILRAG